MTKLKYYGSDDPTPNNVMNNLGDKCYSVDADNIQYEFIKGSSDPVTRCIIDWKHPRTECISYDDKRSKSRTGLKYFRGLANREKVPFFIILFFLKAADGYGPSFYDQTYQTANGNELLHPNGKPPMFYVVPGNKAAMNSLKSNGGKVWFTPRAFKELMLSLRVETFSELVSAHLNDVHVTYPIDTEIDGNSLSANWKNE